MKFELRDYQKQCLDAILDNYTRGIRRQLICLPTGTGKTIIFSSFPAYFKMQKKMLVLAHREELLLQAREKIIHANPELKVGIEQANRSAEEDCDVIVASVPTLGRKSSSRLNRFNSEDFYLVVVDEAHHAAAESYLRIFRRLGLLESDSKKLLVGFTATPKRGDGKGLEKVFQEITFSRSMPEMMEQGYLSPLAGYRVESNIDLTSVNKRMGDFVTSQLAEAVDVDQRNKLVTDVYQKHLAPRKSLCFCVDVNHTKSLAQAFEQQGVPANFVTGETPAKERQQILEDFRQGRIQVLTNCMVLTEGYDESSVEGIILARPTRSSLLYTQMVGRATRLHPGKKEALIIDIVDITRDHSLVTLPTLIGFSENFDLQGATSLQAREALKWVKKHRPWVRADLAESLEDLRFRCKRVNLLEISLPPELAGCARYAWTSLGQNSYGLNIAGGETIIIEQSILGQWEVIHREKDFNYPVGRAKNVKEAIRQAEYYVKQEKPEALSLIKLNTTWRKAPASDKQLSLIRKWGVEVPEELTKGQASHVISMLTLSRKK